jgi:hypothetical protein
MSYLFGDSTPSTLEINYIGFLRDAVDFCVQVLLADQRIAEGRAEVEARRRTTSAEIEQIHKAGALVPKAFEGASLGAPESPAARCAVAIIRAAEDLAGAKAAEVRASLDAEVSKREAEAEQERDACAEALERLLIRHDLPDMKSEIQIALTGGNYACRAQLSTPFGVGGTIELAVPKDHLFERVVRLDRLVERLDVQAPELGGWLHKEIKLRPQHLDKHHVAGLSVGAAGDTLRLRVAPDGSGGGFDVLFSADDDTVRLLRVDEGKEDEPPFDVESVDVPKLQALRGKLVAAAKALMREREALVEAKLDGEPLRGHPKPSLLAERLVAAMTPVVQEIASRSQSPGELVLRRLLGEARREEIFLSKQELKSKIEPLSERNRALFDPLWVVPPPGSVMPTIPPAGAPAQIAVPLPPPPPPPRLDPKPTSGVIDLTKSADGTVVEIIPSSGISAELEIVLDEKQPRS